MLIPPDSVKEPPLWRVILFVLVAVLTFGAALAKCHRALQPRERTATNQSVPLAPIIEIGPVSVGVPAQGTLDVGQRQGWTLTGRKDQRVAIAVYGAWDSYVTLLMPEGTQSLAQDGFSGGYGQALISGVTLPMDGTYRIIVSGENGGAGNYELQVGKGAPAKPAIYWKVGPGEPPIHWEVGPGDPPIHSEVGSGDLMVSQ